MRKIIPVLALLLSIACPGAQAISDDSASEYTIFPGVGIGEIKLGMDKLHITQTMGKQDGKYSLPSRIEVEYAEWKDPDKTSTIRVFFNPAGRAIQFAFEADKPATTDGISTHSTLEDVTKHYPNAKHLRYVTKTGQIDYYDDIRKGIAFEFKGSSAEDKSKKFLYAILVHKPGKHVIAESDHNLLRKVVNLN